MRRLVLVLAFIIFAPSIAVAQPAAEPAAAIEPAPAGPAEQPAIELPAETVTVPDPVESPVESASLLYKLYKAGHLVPAAILLCFLALGLARRWISWLRTGYRRLVVSSVLGGLVMLAERAANGVTPNAVMLMGAIGAALTLYIQGKDAPA